VVGWVREVGLRGHNCVVRGEIGKRIVLREEEEFCRGSRLPIEERRQGKEKAMRYEAPVWGRQDRAEVRGD
jgi:hypothetical protein